MFMLYNDIKSQIIILENIQNCYGNSTCEQINNDGGSGVILPGIGFIPKSQMPPPLRASPTVLGWPFANAPGWPFGNFPGFFGNVPFGLNLGNSHLPHLQFSNIGQNNAGGAFGAQNCHGSQCIQNNAGGAQGTQNAVGGNAGFQNNGVPGLVSFAPSFPNCVGAHCGQNNAGGPTSRQQIVTFYSDGVGAEYAGGWLGEYQYNYQSQIYIQKSTESQSPDFVPRYLFQEPQSKQWLIGTSTDTVEGFFYLWNKETSATVPTSGWQVRDIEGEAWTFDNTLTVSGNAFSACAPIRIHGFEVLAKRWKSKFGDYQETNRWFNGHPVYKKEGGVDLMKMLNNGDWGIGKKINTYGFAGGPGYRSPIKIKSWWSATGRGDGTSQPVKITARCL